MYGGIKFSYSTTVSKGLKNNIRKDIIESFEGSPELRKEMRRVFQMANRRIQNIEKSGVFSPAVASAGDVGLSASYAEREITTLKGETSVKEMDNGIYSLSFPNGNNAWAEKRWPENTELVTFVPKPEMKVADVLFHGKKVTKYM